MGSPMTKKENQKMERLRRLLETERERAEKAWQWYRETLYELVEVKVKLAEIKSVIDERSGQDKN